MIYLDLRGCGRSDRSTRDHWNLARWADDLRDFCDALEIRKPIVLGASFGGPVAMTYATRHPDHPGRLIVCSSIARWRIDRTLDAFECLGGREAREVARRFWDNPTYESSVEYMAMAAPLIVPLAKKRSFTEQDAAFFKRHIAHPFPNQEVGDFFLAGEWQTFNLWPALKRIKCPTIVLSDVDPLASSKDAENMVAAMPKALVQYEHFPEAGHGIAGDSPEQFFSVIRRFITA